VPTLGGTCEPTWIPALEVANTPLAFIERYAER
jgi:hypothetical protein